MRAGERHQLKPSERPKMIRVVLLSAVLCVGLSRAAQYQPFGRLLPGCGKCEPDSCPKTGSSECRGSLVPDLCGCCPHGVCGRMEGEKCFNATLIPTISEEHRKYGMCGDDLYCQLRHDLMDRDEAEALCVCKEPQQACGSDGKSYDSVCELNEEASRIGGHLHLQHWGPCNSAPWIVTNPVDTTLPLHQSLTLDCEVKGSPIPAVHWEFEGHDGTHRVLPSDDLSVAVQVRGGPEPYMVTSWLQIMDLRQTDMGVYSCVGANDEGVTKGSAKVSVRA